MNVCMHDIRDWKWCSNILWLSDNEMGLTWKCFQIYSSRLIKQGRYMAKRWAPLKTRGTFPNWSLEGWTRVLWKPMLSQSDWSAWKRRPVPKFAWATRCACRAVSSCWTPSRWSSWAEKLPTCCTSGESSRYTLSNHCQPQSISHQDCTFNGYKKNTTIDHVLAQVWTLSYVNFFFAEYGLQEFVFLRFQIP